MFEAQAEKRRALLKAAEGQANDFDSAFEKAVRESTHLNECCEKVAQSIFYEHIKVDKQVFMNSSQTYLMDPVKRATYEEEMALIVAAERTKPL